MPDYPQPAIGDRVTYIDGHEDRHRALVVDAVPGSPYITVVTGTAGPLGQEYNYDVDAHTSVFPHESVWDSAEPGDVYAFIPGWLEAPEDDEDPSEPLRASI